MLSLGGPCKPQHPKATIHSLGEPEKCPAMILSSIQASLIRGCLDPCLS